MNIKNKFHTLNTHTLPFRQPMNPFQNQFLDTCLHNIVSVAFLQSKKSLEAIRITTKGLKRLAD